MHNIKIIDNFLDLEDLNKMNSVDLDNIKPNEIKVYHNEIEKNGNISKAV